MPVRPGWVVRHGRGDTLHRHVRAGRLPWRHAAVPDPVRASDAGPLQLRPGVASTDGQTIPRYWNFAYHRPDPDDAPGVAVYPMTASRLWTPWKRAQYLGQEVLGVSPPIPEATADSCMTMAAMR